MVDVKKPVKWDNTVSYVSTPTRQSGTYIIKTNWRTPDRLKSTSYDDRATSLPYEWHIQFTSGKDEVITATGNINDTSKQFNMDNMSGKRRTRFYPGLSVAGSGKKVKSVKFLIRGKNGFNKNAGSKQASATLTFKTPKAPTISDIKHDEQTGNVTCVIKTDAGNGIHERYDTRYKVSIFDTSRSVSGASSKYRYPYDNKSTSTNITSVKGTVADRGLLQPGEYSVIKFEAWARGLMGDSSHTTAYHVVGWPAVPLITDAVIPNKVTADSKIVIRINTCQNTSSNRSTILGKELCVRPTDRVVLEVLKDTTAATAEEAMASNDWEKTSSMDDGNCTALVIDAGSLIPQAGNKTWVRVKAWHDVEDVFFMNSTPRRLTELESTVSSSTSNVCDIISAGPSDDGSCIVVDVAWMKSGGTDVADGTELSWSENRLAWRSNQKPTEMEIPNDWGDTVSGLSGDWTKLARAYILGFKEPTAYIRARRYRDTDDGRTYGEFCDIKPATQKDIPTSVSLTAPSVIGYGQSGIFSWSTNSTATQVMWKLHLVDGRILDNGDEIFGSRVVQWDRILNAITQTKSITGTGEEETLELSSAIKDGSSIIVRCSYPLFESIFTQGTSNSDSWDGEIDNEPWHADIEYDSAENEIIYTIPDGYSAEVICTDSGFDVYASVSTDGNSWTDSAIASVGIIEPPKVILDVDTETITPSGGEPPYEAITSQPISLTLETDDADTIASIKIISHGSDGASPSGMNPQAVGDIVYSDSLKPGWEATQDSLGYTSEITLDNGLNLRDGAGYTVEVQLTNSDNGLSSDVIESDFVINWENQAPSPPYGASIVASTETDEFGFISHKATITLHAIAGISYPYTYEIYRVTMDSSDLIASGLSSNAVVVDEFAPFGPGSHVYRIATRTEDNDVEWEDYEYELDYRKLRFDFGGQYVECPYDIVTSDRHKKDFEGLTHIDGSTSGSWNDGVSRNAALSTKMVWFKNKDEIAAVRALARHAGPVFVRTPSGTAFQANVDVSNIDEPQVNGFVLVSFDASEISLTDDFRPTI